MDRRQFLKISAVAGTGAAAAACSSPVKSEQSLEGAKVTCREWGGKPVSLLGYGCMRWPKTKNESGEDVLDQEMINKLVDVAMEHGVNYYDTAPVYLQGQSEKVTGIALNRHPRESFYIATKMSAYGKDFGGEQRAKSIEMYQQSFKELQVDYIDYYLIHAVGGGGLDRLHKRLLDIGLLDYFLEERKAGRIRNLGFSFHGDRAVFDYLLSIHDQVHWDFVQIQLNYSDWQHPASWNVKAEYLYNELAKRNIPAVVMEPLLGGRLAELPTLLGDRLKERMPEASIASWSFRYDASLPDVMTCLSGMTYMEHLEDNIKTFSPLVPVTDEEKHMLEDIAAQLVEYREVPCTGCQYCMPCPYGIDIPGIFKYYNKRVKEGGLAVDANDETWARARRAFLIGYDRAIPTLRQSDHCIGCGKCLDKCPQSIKIPTELSRIDRHVEKLKRGNLKKTQKETNG